MVHISQIPLVFIFINWFVCTEFIEWVDQRVGRSLAYDIISLQLQLLLTLLYLLVGYHYPDSVYSLTMHL